MISSQLHQYSVLFLFNLNVLLWRNYYFGGIEGVREGRGMERGIEGVRDGDRYRGN